MYLFSEQDVLIFDTSTFKQVDKWELSRPVEEGFGAFEFGRPTPTNDEPGFYTAMFQVQDPVQKRRMMGVGRVNLAAKKVDFYTLGPATQVGFTMAPGRKKAYGLLQRDRTLRVLDVRSRQPQAGARGPNSPGGRACR